MAGKKNMFPKAIKITSLNPTPPKCGFTPFRGDTEHSKRTRIISKNDTFYKAQKEEEQPIWLLLFL